MDDNARPHRACVVTDYLENETIERMHLPSLLPNLNPTEHAWDKLQQTILVSPELPRNCKELSIYLTLIYMYYVCLFSSQCMSIFYLFIYQISNTFSTFLSLSICFKLCLQIFVHTFLHAFLFLEIYFIDSPV
jgi:hypothetical protein